MNTFSIINLVADLTGFYLNQSEISDVIDAFNAFEKDTDPQEAARVIAHDFIVKRLNGYGFVPGKIELKMVEIVNIDDSEQTYKLFGYVLPSGALWIRSEDNSDYFFKSQSAYKPNGFDTNVRITNFNTHVDVRANKQTLAYAIQGSLKQFGVDSVPTSVLRDCLR